jgi:hypothetical protein
MSKDAKAKSVSVCESVATAFDKLECIVDSFLTGVA